jgi:DNA-binding NarL/FixJ family response regulator
MKIGIADSQGRVRFSLRVLLEQQPGWMIVGEAEDDHELFELLHGDPPDLLLIDYDLSDMPVKQLLRLLRVQSPQIQVIMMSGKQELCKAAIMAGADAFACKTESAEKLLRLICALEQRS